MSISIQYFINKAFFVTLKSVADNNFNQILACQWLRYCNAEPKQQQQPLKQVV